MNEVDLERLAEYAEGLLDPVAAAEVRHRLDTDREWAATLAQLRAAMPRVSARLAADPAPPLPTGFASRLDAALTAAATGQPVPGAGRPAADGTSSQPTGTVIALATRRRRVRLALAAAAAVVAVVLSGLGGLLLTNRGVTDNSADLSAGRPALAPASQEFGGQNGRGRAEGGLPLITRSGRDYTAATLASAGQASMRADGLAPAAPGLTGPSGAAGQRLDDLQALATCLNAVVAQFGGSPTVIDLARYEGRPAAIVVLAGIDRTVAVGQHCGEPDRGTDLIYVTTTR